MMGRYGMRDDAGLRGEGFGEFWIGDWRFWIWDGRLAQGQCGKVSGSRFRVQSSGIVGFVRYLPEKPVLPGIARFIFRGCLRTATNTKHEGTT